MLIAALTIYSKKLIINQKNSNSPVYTRCRNKSSGPKDSAVLSEREIGGSEAKRSSLRNSVNSPASSTCASSSIAPISRTARATSSLCFTYILGRLCDNIFYSTVERLRFYVVVTPFVSPAFFFYFDPTLPCRVLSVALPFFITQLPFIVLFICK